MPDWIWWVLGGIGLSALLTFLGLKGLAWAVNKGVEIDRAQQELHSG